MPAGWMLERSLFVGRAGALQEISESFSSGARLVTILGTAGLGKTRLLRRFGAHALQQGESVWFCDLTPAQSFEDVLVAVARGLEIALTAGITAVGASGQLGHAIAAQGPGLILLDNFERAAAHAQATVGRWLALAPAVRFLISSRQVLGLDEEVRYELDPLSLAEGVALFHDRARRVHAGALATDSPEIAKIVQHLDGNPLAIEMAAARTVVLSPAQILSRLADRFELLRTTRPPQPEHHLTLESAIEWSFNALAPWEMSALGQCTVFAGAFSLRAAEAVVDVSAFPDAPPVLDILHSLRDKSLLRRINKPDLELALFESIRAYADGRVRADCTAAAAFRHAQFFVAAAEPWASLAGGPDWQSALSHLSTALDDLTAIVHRVVVPPSLRLRAALAADTHLDKKGPLAARLNLLEVGAAALNGLADGPLEVRYRRALANACRNQGQLDPARSILLSALDVVRKWGDLALESRILGELAEVDFEQSKFEVARLLQHESLVIARQSGDRAALAQALCQPLIDGQMSLLEETRLVSEVDDVHIRIRLLANLGLRGLLYGTYEQAFAHYHQGCALAQRIGDAGRELTVGAPLALLEQALGHCDAADTIYLRLLTLVLDTGNRRLEGMMSTFMGVLRCAQERWSEAQGPLEKGIVICEQVGELWAEGVGLGCLGALFAVQNRLNDAERALALARSRSLLIEQSSFVNRLPDLLDIYERIVDLGRAQRAEEQGDLQTAASLRKKVQQYAENLQSDTKLPQWNWVPISAVKHVLNSALRHAAAVPQPSAVLEVSSRCGWFKLTKGQRVSLSTRGAARRILASLVEARLHHPGQPVQNGQLIAAGWPQERILTAAANNRLRNAIAGLRSLGLKNILRRMDQGYLLDPELPLIKVQDVKKPSP